MTFTHDDFNYTLRLEKGERLAATLLSFIKEKKISGGWVVGIGGLAWAELGFYDLESQEYSWSKFEEPLELTSLTGNIAWQDEEPILHMHANVSDPSFHVKGGHLKEAEAAGTVELFIHMWDEGAGFSRAKDPQTGLNILSFKHE